MNDMTPARGGEVGRSLPRLEASAKVTGRVEYVHTMRLPGMLVAKLVRSTVAHGRIKSINIDEAMKVPGVERIVTSADVCKIIPHPYYGPAFHDQPILAIDKVVYVGEPVAAVIGALAVVSMRPLLPYALAFAAGAMIFVVVEEVIPESQRGGNSDLATLGAMVGFAVMMTLDVGLG